MLSLRRASPSNLRRSGCPNELCRQHLPDDPAVQNCFSESRPRSNVMQKGSLAPGGARRRPRLKGGRECSSHPRWQATGTKRASGDYLPSHDNAAQSMTPRQRGRSSLAGWQSAPFSSVVAVGLLPTRSTPPRAQLLVKGHAWTRLTFQARPLGAWKAPICRLPLLQVLSCSTTCGGQECSCAAAQQRSHRR